MGDVVILVPVLRRPHRARPVVESIRAATPQPHRILFVSSPGDDAEHDACRAAGGDLLVIDRPHGPGDYQRKIQAGYDATDEPYLLLGADDLDFHPGWLPAAMARMTDRIGVVGTNDLGNPRVMRGEHSTHCLVARWYVERFGTIDQPGQVMHEGYVHEYADDELVGTAKRRRAWAFAGDSHVEHLHPSWGKAPTDDLYDAQAQRMRTSRRHYVQRRRLWM